MSRMMLRRDMTLLRGLLFGGRQQLCNFSNTTTRAASSSSSSQAAPDKAPEDSSSSSSDWFNQVTAGDIDERVVPKPVSVMPDHLPQVRRRQHQKPWWKFRHFVDIHTKPTDPAASEYTETPQYPPIYDTSPEGIRKQVRKEWYAAIRRLPSAEQKIYEITKHYGHLSYMIEPVGRLFNGLAIQQAITRTVLLHELPPSYSTTDLELDGRLKDALLTAIANRLFQSRSRPAFVHFKRSALSRFGFADGENYVQSAKEEDILADVASIVRGFSSSSAQSTETALLQVDYNAAVAASWWVNDFPVPFPKKHWFRDEKTRDQLFTYKSTHALHLRSETPLVQSVPFTDPLLSSLPPVAPCATNLLRLGFPLHRHNIMSLPGFWPSRSDGFDFPYLIGHSRELQRARQAQVAEGRDFGDSEEVVDGAAITSAFAWLCSLANNLGFTLYDHLTYPLVTQVVSTDGQRWAFHVYQLNDHAFHSDVTLANPPPNICWSSGELKLFEGFSEEDGTLTGVNEEVLKLIVKFFTAPTQSATTAAANLRPYLSADDRPQQDKDELSYSLRRKFANQVNSYIARRKKVNLWETIYKNHKDAPQDSKRIRPKIDFKFPPFFKR